MKNEKLLAFIVPLVLFSLYTTPVSSCPDYACFLILVPTVELFSHITISGWFPQLLLGVFRMLK